MPPMMHVPSPSNPLLHSQRHSVGQRPPVSPAEHTSAQLLAAPSIPSLLRSPVQACALVILVLGFLGQLGTLRTWSSPERMPCSEPLPCYSPEVEDDSLEGAPPGVMALTVGAL